MINWAQFPFVRYTPALIAGIVAYLFLGAAWPSLWPWAMGGVGLAILLTAWASRQPGLTATDLAGLFSLVIVVLLGAALTQRAVEARRADHLFRFGSRVECYRAVVDDYTVVRAATYATTLRVQAVRMAGRWQQATGGVRVSLPRVAGIAEPHYGEVWLIRGHPDPSKPPLNPGEFDYRRYLEYRQVYHQQYVHPDQYRVLGLDPPNPLVAVSMRANKVIEGVFRHYIHARREYAIAAALVLGTKDDVDDETKRAYANTGTTHIMAVSGMQVGLLFMAISWLLSKLFGRLRGFPYWAAGVGLVVIWSYAFLTGLSASVLRATVMFSFVIAGRLLGRQDTIFNTLAVAAFALLVWNPFMLADVGFQLSFLAVLSIVYLQPRIVKRFDARAFCLARRRPWQPRAVQRAWQGVGWLLDLAWQAAALSVAAQVATCALGLFYFHQFPLSFLISNLGAVPISSLAVYVGLALLALKGLVALLGLMLPGAAGLLDLLPRLVAALFEGMVWLFNEYIFLISRVMAGWTVRDIHISALQTVLIFGIIGAVLAWAHSKQLQWMRWAAVLVLAYAGSRVWDARQVAPSEDFIVYSIPRRSAVGFWQGAAAEFVTVDSLPLTETERTYRLLPGIIQREARRTAYRVGWHGAAVPAACVPDTSRSRNPFFQPGPVVLAQWRGLRIAFVAGRLSPATQPVPVDVVVLRRNARLKAATLAAVFGIQARVVFDSSCKIWYVARQDSALRRLGFRTWDVTAQGAYHQRPRAL